MRTKRVCVLVASMMINGCASSGTRTPVRSTNTSTSAEGPQTACFEGTSEVFVAPRAADARPVAVTRALIQRTVDPEHGRIVETVVSDQGARGGVREFVVVMRVSGSTFTMEEQHGAFRGEGTLDGQPWRWTAWTSHAVMPDGSTVDSRDRLGDGGLDVLKEYRSARGTMEMVEHFDRIECTVYQQRRHAFGVDGASSSNP